MKSYSRSKVFEILGAVPTNPRWAWCAMHAQKKFAVFTIWKDLIDGKTTRLTSPNPDTLNLLGGRDQERIIDEVLRLKIPAYGLICHARDTEAKTRSIKGVDADYLICLKLERVNGVAFAHHKGQKHILEVAGVSRDSAIDDLSDSSSIGCDIPDRALQHSFSFKRDSKVRRHVIERAGGNCEYCGKKGFLTAGGVHFVEAHHVISLAKQGPDRPGNVIGLCPEHHRQAHFGKEAEKLEREFSKILNDIASS